MSAPPITPVHWVPIGNIKGPPGEDGDDGVGLLSATFDPQGRLVLHFTDGQTFVSQSLIGPAGPPGRSVTITGSVPSSIDLPTDYGPTDAGLGWLTSDDGHLHVWSGTEFIDVGAVQGPPGPPGPPGDSSDAGTYVRNFASPSALWEVTHDLASTQVVVATYDLYGEEIEAGVWVVDENTVRISYEFPTTGSVVIQR